MSTIPFVEASFFDPKSTVTALEHRFAAHLRRLRASGFPSVPDRENEMPDEDEAGLHDLLLLSSRDQRIIRRRAERLVQRRIAASGLGTISGGTIASGWRCCGAARG